MPEPMLYDFSLIASHIDKQRWVFVNFTSRQVINSSKSVCRIIMAAPVLYKRRNIAGALCFVLLSSQTKHEKHKESENQASRWAIISFFFYLQLASHYSLFWAILIFSAVFSPLLCYYPQLYQRNMKIQNCLLFWNSGAPGLERNCGKFIHGAPTTFQDYGIE